LNDPPEVFRCTRCGNCCRWPGWVYLTPYDIQQLAAYLEMDERAFIQAFTVLAPNRHQLCLKNQENDACIFLHGRNECHVYAARPLQCRQYPDKWTVPKR
jgi:hypothetical protein